MLNHTRRHGRAKSSPAHPFLGSTKTVEANVPGGPRIRCASVPDDSVRLDALDLSRSFQPSFCFGPILQHALIRQDAKNRERSSAMLVGHF